MVMFGDAFFGEDIQKLGAMATAGDWEDGEGTVGDADIMDLYVARLLINFDGGAFRIGWDAGNGAAGPVVEQLFAGLPGEAPLLYTDVHRRFPKHHTQPHEQKNIQDLKAQRTQ